MARKLAGIAALALLSIAQPGATEDGYYRLRQSVDPITDATECSVTPGPAYRYREYGGPPIAIVINGRLSIGIMGEEFPGEKSAIRVDQNPPHVFEEMLRGDAARRLVEEIRAGEAITTRYSDWPYNINRDNQHPTSNFAQLVDACLGR